jgi:protein-disulfide isomerase/uncharacterized membrane protein
MFAALLLVLAHFDKVALPGCGPASDCTRASESRWGTLPGTEWPLSFLGFAYFQALAAAFIFGSGRLPAILRVIVSIGAAFSALLTVVMLVEGYLCGYCLAIHVLNLTFAVGYEAFQWLPGSRQSAVTPNRLPMVIAFTATFVLTALLLAVVDHQATAATTQAAKSRLNQALDQARSSGKNVDSNSAAAFAPGRYYLGPQTAAVHVVVVSDYQCPSCRTIDEQLRSIIVGRTDISVSARHFPFCTDCNGHIDKTRHANACRAALAAEAAGIVGGADAFWQLHNWLFEQRGEFTDGELAQFVQELGLDRAAFLAAMHDEKTLDVIRSDVAAANSAGLRFTPMIFINGQPINVEP